MSTNLVLDANLTLLFVVGTAKLGYIGQHKRLSTYTTEDFELLRGFIAQARIVTVTPNTLTETSNLIPHIK